MKEPNFFLDSTIDSNRFGVKAAKINDVSYLDKAVLDWLKKNEFKFIITRIDSNEIQRINELGFISGKFIMRPRRGRLT